MISEKEQLRVIEQLVRLSGIRISLRDGGYKESPKFKIEAVVKHCSDECNIKRDFADWSELPDILEDTYTEACNVKAAMVLQQDDPDDEKRNLSLTPLEKDDSTKGVRAWLKDHV